MIRLTITDMYGAELARFECEGEPKAITVHLPGYSDEAWMPLATELRSLGMKEDTALGLGPLIRFNYERIDT